MAIEQTEGGRKIPYPSDSFANVVHCNTPLEQDRHGERHEKVEGGHGMTKTVSVLRDYSKAR